MNVTGGRITAVGEILTGPGPSGAYGPHVRAFHYEAGTVSPLAKVSFFAYGTLRFGVGVSGAALDADAYDEIVSGAGPGAVFGPHIRAFDYDDRRVLPRPARELLCLSDPAFRRRSIVG